MDKPFKNVEVSCNNCSLDTICLPRGLTQTEVEKLNQVVKNNSVLQHGEYIYRQGDIFKGIIAIKSGSAKLVSGDSQGNEHILDILLPGELVGFDGLSDGKHNCSVIALEVLSYCELPAKKIDTLCQRTPGITRELFKHSSESINTSRNKIILGKRTAEEKLALFLTDLSQRLESRGFSPLSFNISLTRQELGNYLNLTIETVSRILQRFQNKGLITVQRKHIEIKDLKSLQSIYSQLR